jgi:hypothetical protein
MEGESAERGLGLLVVTGPSTDIDSLYQTCREDTLGSTRCQLFRYQLQEINQREDRRTRR